MVNSFSCLRCTSPVPLVAYFPRYYDDIRTRKYDYLMGNQFVCSVNTIHHQNNKTRIFFYIPGFEIVPIRVSETCQNLSGHVKCPCMVIRWTCPIFQLATRLTGVTRRDALSRYKSRQCISCWRAARCSWSRSRYPRVRAVVGR